MSDNEIRTLRYKLKQANRNVGKQGETIHKLRAELAEVRQLNSRIERGELRAYDKLTKLLSSELDMARNEIQRLNEKLSPTTTLEVEVVDADG
jgi:septal ring factor EnvC (AmiA/AmiB activator)